MPIYKVTTEGDVEGRTIKHLGYIEADSEEHAVKFLKSIGVNEFYQYSVKVVEYPIMKATKKLKELSDYVAVSSEGYDGTYWKVSEKEESIKRKKENVQRAIAELGISKEELLKYLGDK